MKKALITPVFIGLFSVSYSQIDCGVDQRIIDNKDIYIPTSLQNPNHVLKPINDTIVKVYTPMNNIPVDVNTSFPLLPGFEPTGNPDLDKETYMQIKVQIWDADPEEYKKLSRNPNPIITERNPE